MKPPREVGPDAARSVGAGWSTPRKYRNVAPRAPEVLGMYGVLIAVLFVVLARSSSTAYAFVLDLLILVMLVFLARYASTTYTMDGEFLSARRLFGSRRIRLADVRRIQLANLRDLGPVSAIGGWGWRGRMWSPTVGTFDSIHTVSPGVLVTVDSVPLFVSPRDRVAFGRELSRRVRSIAPGVELDSELAE